MKTLEFLNIDDCQPGVIQDVWNHNSDPLEARIATVKTRLLVQRYPLGYSYYACKNKMYSVLCAGDEETLNTSSSHAQP